MDTVMTGGSSKASATRVTNVRMAWERDLPFPDLIFDASKAGRGVVPVRRQATASGQTSRRALRFPRKGIVDSGCRGSARRCAAPLRGNAGATTAQLVSGCDYAEIRLVRSDGRCGFFGAGDVLVIGLNSS